MFKTDNGDISYAIVCGFNKASKELRDTNSELKNINETLKSYTCTLYDSSEKEVQLNTIFNNGIIVRENIISIFKEGNFNIPKLDVIMEFMEKNYSLKNLLVYCKTCFVDPFNPKICGINFYKMKLIANKLSEYPYDILMVLHPKETLENIIDYYSFLDLSVNDFSVQLKQIESYIDKNGLKEYIDFCNERIKPYIEQALDILFKNNLKEKIEFKRERLTRDSIIFTFGEYTLLIKRE